MKGIDKGRQIRNDKLARRAVKSHSIKSGQEHVCRFVEIKYEAFSRENGKVKHKNCVCANGLQIGNKVFLLDGHYKLVNSKSVSIMKKLTGIPTWVDDALIKRYNEFISKSTVIVESKNP